MAVLLEIKLLGAPQVTLDSLPVTGFVSRKAEALLYYLACTGRAHTRDSLAGLLWSESSDSAARTNLRGILANLRGLVGAHLRIDRQTLAFDTTSPHTIDAVQFAQGVGAAIHTKTLTPSQTDHLQHCLDLCRGEFLDGFYVKNAPEFERWMLTERARLRDLAVQGGQSLAHYFAERAEWPAATAAIRGVLNLEPWREQAHRQLMLFLAQSGQRSAALAHFEVCRRVLADELDVPPSDETIALAQQIRAGAFGPASGEESPASIQPATPTPPTLSNNLPAQSTLFVGRTDELTTLETWLADPGCRMVTILGAGGMGKSRLALALAEQLLPSYRDGVYFVELAPIEHPEGIVPAIANAIGYVFQNDRRSAQTQLADFLRLRQTLLVLDNWEHLLAGSQKLVELLHAAPQVQMVLTSRERLRVGIETLFSLSGMDYPSGETGDVRYSAVALFVETMRRQQRTLPQNQAEWAAVAHICRLVDGIPLAIVLAAGWLGLLRLEEIAQEIESSGDILETDLRDTPPRQRSMRIVFEHTWQRLSQTEQNLYARLSIFHDGFTDNAARRVAGATLSVLRGLTDKALLWRDADDRYHIHELLRQYAREKLAAQQIDGEMRQFHGAYYIDMLSRSEPDLYGHSQLLVVEMLQAEEANLRAAWQWALQNRPFAGMEQVVQAWGLFYEISGRSLDGEAILRVAMEQLDEASKESRAYTRLLIWYGVFGENLSGDNYASSQYHRSLEIADRLAAAGQDMRFERTFALLELGHVLWYVDGERANHYLSQSLALCRDLQNPWLLARVLQEEARVIQIAGNFIQAGALAAESLAIWQSMGDKVNQNPALVVLGWSAMKLDATEQAFSYVQKQLEIGEALRNGTIIAGSLFSQGAVLEHCGDFAGAARAYIQSIQVAEDMGLRQRVNSSKYKLVYIHVQLGDYTTGVELAQSMLPEVDAMGLYSHRAHLLTAIGLAYMGQGNYDLARQPIQESEQMFRRLNQHAIYHIKSDGFLGYIARAAGNESQAWEHVYRSLRWGIEQEDVQTLSMTLPLAALLLADRGEVDRAVTLYALTCQHPRISDSRWYADVVGREMNRLVSGPSAARVDAVPAANHYPLLHEASLALMP